MGSMSGTNTMSLTWPGETQHIGMYIVGYGQSNVVVELKIRVNGKEVFSGTPRGNFFLTADLGKFVKGESYGLSLEWKTKGNVWQGIAFFTDEYPDGKVPKSPMSVKDPCIYARLAESLIDYERTHEGNLLLDIILKKNSDCATAWYAKGELMNYWEDSRQAMAAYEQALKHNPKETGALRGLGQMYVTTGQSSKSKDMFRTVLETSDANLNDVGVSIVGYLALEVADDRLKEARDYITKISDANYAKIVEAILLVIDKHEGKSVSVDNNDDFLLRLLGFTAHNIRKVADDISKTGTREAAQRTLRLARNAEKLLPDM